MDNKSIIENFPKKTMKVLPTIPILTLCKILQMQRKEFALGIIEKKGALRLVQKIENIQENHGDTKSSIHIIDDKGIDLTKVPSFLYPYFRNNKGVPFYIDINQYYKNVMSSEYVESFFKII